VLGMDGNVAIIVVRYREIVTQIFGRHTFNEFREISAPKQNFSYLIGTSIAYWRL
jgi:hypothetical protein